MKHKTLARIAIAMVVIFGLITIVYPRIFAPKSPTPVEATPAAQPQLPPVAPAGQ